MKIANNKQWEDWCDAFLAAKAERMSNEMTHAFIQLQMMELKASATDLADMYDQASKNFQFQVFDSRIKSLNLKMTVPVELFVVMLCKNLGSVVMYAHALKRLAMLKAYEYIDFARLVDHFQEGFLPESELHRVWDMQKQDTFKGTRMDNFLDGVSA